MKDITKWDRRYMRIAKEVATWSKDPSSKVGAVIIGKNGKPISQGYNGFPYGIEDTDERLNNRELKYKLVVHAEANAIYNAFGEGASVEGSTIYATTLPVCNECAKAIIQTRIKRVVMEKRPTGRWEESGELSLKMFKEAGVEVTFLDENYENSIN